MRELPKPNFHADLAFGCSLAIVNIFNSPQDGRTKLYSFATPKSVATNRAQMSSAVT